MSKANDAVKVEKLNIVEMDGFTARHSLCAATWNEKTVMFGGQDVIKELCLNEVYSYNHKNNELEKLEHDLQEFLKNKETYIIPAKRNSHTFVQNEKVAYIYGGANEDGPLNDAFSLDLETLKFSKIKIEDVNMAPYFEMHTSHLYKGDKLLLIGGRSHVLPS